MFLVHVCIYIYCEPGLLLVVPVVVTAPDPVTTPADWEQRKEKIRREMPFVDIKEYYHNIIGMSLPSNEEDMKKMTCELQLGKLGWQYLSDGSYPLTDADKFKNDCVFFFRVDLLCSKAKKNVFVMSSSNIDNNTSMTPLFPFYCVSLLSFLMSVDCLLSNIFFLLVFCFF